MTWQFIDTYRLYTTISFLVCSYIRVAVKFLFQMHFQFLPTLACNLFWNLNLPFQLSWNSTLHIVLKPTPLRTSMYILKLSFISHWAVLPRQIDQLFCSPDLGAEPPTHYSSPFIPYPSSSPRLSIHPIAPDTPLFSLLSSAFHIKPPNHNRP